MCPRTPPAHHSRMGYADLGARVRARRILRGQTQEQLAVSAGITTATLGRLELGKLAQPKLPTIDALASALGVSSGYLVSGEGGSPAPAGLLDTFRGRPLGASATPEEMLLVRAAAEHAPGEPTLAFLEALLALSRGLIPADTFSETVALNDAVDRGELDVK